VKQTRLLPDIETWTRIEANFQLTDVVPLGGGFSSPGKFELVRTMSGSQVSNTTTFVQAYCSVVANHAFGRTKRQSMVSEHDARGHTSQRIPCSRRNAQPISSKSLTLHEIRPLEYRRRVAM
jgi:hypothetical protein